jgi:hypothetical protein
MEERKNNGSLIRFILGFFTLILGVWLVVLTQGVVANDRIRQVEDTRISTKIEVVKDNIYRELVSINRSLAKIEAKLENE